MTAPRTLNKTIVAIHGIGEQTRFATIQQVLTQFSLYHGRGRAVTLGQFHTPEGVYKLSYTYPPAKSDQPPLMVNLNFAETYWADIPRSMVKEGFLLEDARLWAKSIVRRVHERAQDAAGEDATAYRAEGRSAAFKLALKGEAPSSVTLEKIEEVLTEMLQTLVVLDRIFFLAGKLKLFTFNLNTVLEDFLDDVQVVAEFQTRRQLILDAFDKQMEQAYQADPDAEIYIVAHSEGTVVALIGLLEAAHKYDGAKPEWLKRVRGLMTIGSPIDKHIELWPELFAGYEKATLKYHPAQEDKIEWRNYCDLGDPVGYELDEARARVNGVWRLKEIFNFTDDHDHDFTRYPLPGKAHNDYWADDAVMGHFIKNVVYHDDPIQPPQPAGKDYSQEPRDKHWNKIVSHFVPYAGAALLLFCAVLMIYKAVNSYTTANFQLSAADLPYLGATTCLLVGLTLVARIVRLTRPGFWWLFGIVFFLLSIVGYRLLLSQGLVADHQPGFFNFGLVSIAVAVFLASLLGGLLFPSWGMRTLLIPGGVGLLSVIARRVLEGADASSWRSIARHLANGAGDTSLWSVVLTIALFLFLWWLVALIFDLVFVWHRYIRYSQRNMKVTS